MARIPFKIGICTGCLALDKKLISKLCFEAPYFCYQKRQQKKYQEKQITVKKAPIKSVSVRMMEKLRLYRKLRDEFFEREPVCQFPGCSSREVTLHHGRGRVGTFLTDTRYFRSLCWPHHQFCEHNPAEAQRLKLSFKRLAK